MTAVVITYIPVLGGYYAEALEVLKACLASMRSYTKAPFDLLVFDNASCGEVRAYLQAQQTAGQIQYLVLTEKNLGKAGAWNFAFAGAPGEVIAYAAGYQRLSTLDWWVRHLGNTLAGLKGRGVEPTAAKKNGPARTAAGDRPMDLPPGLQDPL